MDKNKERIWYKDDHFQFQFKEPYQKKLIYERWARFDKIFQKSNFKSKKKLHVLDLGCGDGVNIKGLETILSNSSQDFQIYGYDYSQLRLERIKERFPKLNVKRFDIIKDNPNKKFDFILLNHVLEHIPETEIALEKINLMLAKNGNLIISVPNEGCFIAWLRNNVFQRKNKKYTDHVHFFTKDFLVNKLELNFEVIDFYTGGFFMPHDRLQLLLRKNFIGDKLLRILNMLIPSQSAEIIFHLKKK